MNIKTVRLFHRASDFLLLTPKIISKTAFYLTAILIAILSLVSLNFNKTEEIADVSIRLDYFYHLFAYFFLVIFLLMWKYKKNSGNKFMVAIFSFGLIFIFQLTIFTKMCCF